MKAIFILFMCFTLSISCNSQEQTDSTIETETVVASNDSILSVDSTESIHNKIAHHLSGTAFYYENDSSSISKSKWDNYAKTISSNWEMIEEKRLQPMREWESDYFKNEIDDSLGLLYAFSGPDFLHAYTLFPNATEYIFLANEKIGQMPDFDIMTETEQLGYLHNIDYFLRDIYKRSYFITNHMWTDIRGKKVEGVLPIFYVFLSRTGHEILDVEAIKLENDGNISVYPDTVEIPNTTFRGVRFSFRKNGETKEKTLSYFYCDISDSGFKKQPEMKSYLENLEIMNGFIKSASYLMHYNSFSTIRNLLLEKTQALFQDDTGIPFKHFDKTIHGFTLFGKYVKPISDFSEDLTQEDFKHAYSSKDFECKELPFSLGYHWYTNNQNYMLIRKN